MSSIVARKFVFGINIMRARVSRSIHVSSFEKYNNVKLASNFSLNLLQKRLITEDSWVADKLIKAGEKLEKGTDELLELSADIVKNPPDHVKQLCNQILCLNVIEVHQLMNFLQRRLGISDAEISGFTSGGGGGPAANAGAVEEQKAAAPEPVKVKEVFDIKLTVVAATAKIKIIKEVRAMTGLGLKEAKELVEKAPVVIKEGLKKEEADGFMKLLTDAGAQAELL